MNIRLKSLLQSPDVHFAMEAHDGLSAKIAVKAGFPILWASGFAISAALGHRDCNEISWSDLARQVEFIVSSSQAQVLVDGDTGFGNFNTVREFVKKLVRVGAAGICLEDKIFPKTNSFLSYNQVLTSIPEFQGKIRAANDVKQYEQFCVVARTEALIAGQPIESALERAYAYKEAGADAIIAHSKQSDPTEIIQFCSQWDYSIPLVLIPTQYATSDGSLYRNLRISLVIWANHLLRSAYKAMQNTATMILDSQSPRTASHHLCTMQEVFHLMEEEEVELAEIKYCGCTHV